MHMHANSRATCTTSLLRSLPVICERGRHGASTAADSELVIAGSAAFGARS